MTSAGWGEILVTVALAVAAAWPVGAYLARVWAGQPTWLDPVLGPVERALYRLAGIDPRAGQGWFDYAMALLSFNAAGFVLLYGLLRLQGVMPLNPLHAPGMSPDLAFNTAISFVTNTDWQAYAGETSASPLAQMAGFTVQNFVSAAVGLSVAAALTRAFATSRARHIGNFWVDLVRGALYLLLPAAIIFALILVLLGEPQAAGQAITAHTLEGARQTIPMGPIASQQAITQLGTNGAGYFNANAAHPFENPNPLSNMLQAAAMNVMGFACVFAFGRSLRMRREASALATAMTVICLIAAGLIYYGEARPTPAVAGAQVQASVNMEGKETRFGAPATATFAAMTTGSSTGSVNAMHESLTPLSGGVTMFLMQLGEMLPGGIGSGLASIVVMALLAMLVAGLMVGRTPQYLGKKIEAREIKLAMLSVLILSVSILGFSAVAAITPAALAGLSATGPHGLIEILYTYASGAANNGSAFQGLNAASPYWNITLGVVMAMGRYGFMTPVLALAGGLAAKPKLPPTEGTFPTDGPLFVGLLLSVILILAGLQFFPSLALGPMAEEIQMRARLSGPPPQR